MGKTATPGFCPYCKTALNSGATACTGCGAFETTKWDELGISKGGVRILFWLPGLLIPLIVVFFSPLMALIILVACFAGYFFYQSRKKRKIVWAVGGRRTI